MQGCRNAWRCLLGESLSILDLPGLVDDLGSDDADRFDRLFRVSTTLGRMRVPDAMRPWVTKQFGSVEAVESQHIVKVTNLVTLEGALFNEIRSCRPFEAPVADDLEEIIRASEGGPFCKPLTGTPEDVFGRVTGEHSITASNVAKYDGFHGLVIFDEHNPLSWSEEQVADHFATGLEWARRANAEAPDAVYFFLMWNCLWKSGASIVHGHSQVALSRDSHYAKVEWWRRCAESYRTASGEDLFADLWLVHDRLGLAWEDGDVRGMAYLTPVKEKEVLLLAPEMGRSLAAAVYRVLHTMVQDMGVRSFNVALYMPPLGDTPESWEGFPVMARIVDRGDLTNRVADFGAMELYASSVIASDPFRVASVLRQGLAEVAPVGAR